MQGRCANNKDEGCNLGALDVNNLCKEAIRQRTYSTAQEHEERRIVSSSDTIVHPLAMMITTIYAIITLQRQIRMCERLDSTVLTILQ